jgi:hypothetical protein
MHAWIDDLYYYIITVCTEARARGSHTVPALSTP